jgi:hypothetical protein
MKIDVEGHEPFVTEGSKRLIQCGKIKNILLEYRSSPRETMQVFWDAGYVIVDDFSYEGDDNAIEMTRMMSLQDSMNYIDTISPRLGKKFYNDLWLRRVEHSLGTQAVGVL